MLINIQILRGLAALWVFFHHSRSHFLEMGLNSYLFELIASLGYIGVDVFFVISGLVICKSTEKFEQSKSSATEFLKKRFLRVYLGYLPIFLFTFLIIYFYLPEKLSSVNLWQSSFLAGIYMENLLIPQAWSLPFELYFYLLVATALFLKLRNYSLLFLFIVLLVVLKINLMDYRRNEFLDLIFTPMLVEFFLGFYLWRYRKLLIQRKYLFLYVIMATITIYLAAEYYLVATSFRGLVLGAFSASVIAVLLILEGKTPKTLIQVLKPIGDSSYTLYLLHYVALVLFTEVGLKFWFVENGMAPLGFIAMILIVLIFSHQMYLLVEKPLYKYSKKLNFGLTYT